MKYQIKKILPIFLIILSIIALLGTSYALLRSSQTGENTYVMNVGLLEVSFVDSKTNALTLDNMVPMSDSEGAKQEKELTFTIKNTGDFAAEYDVYIEETSTSKEFKTVIRFISNKDNKGYNNPKTLSDDKYIDLNGALSVGEEASYKVKVWLGESADSTYMNQTFTARIVVTSRQSKNLAANIKSNVVSNKTETCQTSVLEDGITYISGTKDCIDFNYIWYSGKLWRITAIYPDGTVKLIMDDGIAVIRYGSDANFYNDESNKAYMYQWLNEDFLDTLYNYENIIVRDAKWNVTNSNATSADDISTKLPETTMVTAPVGLLSSYEYYMSYKNTNSESGYLNIGYSWWLLNPYSSSDVWCVNRSGYGYYGSPSSHSGGIRPSIYLQSTIELLGGTGTKSNPYRISGDKEKVTANTTLLNTRTSGEYVTFDGEMYRIVSIEDGKTKINKNDYVKDESNTVLTKMYSNNTTWGSGTSDDYWDYYLTNTWYNAISETYKNMIVEGTYYLGTTSDSYKGAICKVASNTVTTKDCDKTESIWSGYVGLPRYGEMFASQQGSGTSGSSAMWLMNPSSSSHVWYVFISGFGNSNGPSSDAYGVRPSIHLTSGVKITGGTGLPNNPYEISL